MESDDGAREICQRMAALRRELAHDAQKLEAGVQSVGRSARELADWRFYVEHFPFAAAAVAAVVGYLAVPSKPHVIVPDADTLAAMARNNQVWLKTGRARAVEKERGMIGGLVALAMTAAGRMALNWAAQQFNDQLSGSRREVSADASDGSHMRTSNYPPR